ncbi:uncharacterized protein LOC115980158 [Quercus lobata]|uniref:uncharacterized protein LOC115980158 n=1 Tax=Quercus lobata TaxID=97700 RepID=UPI00124485A8|nr:uncharacterized protein LOC115980158 [Quercus lobata]
MVQSHYRQACVQNMGFNYIQTKLNQLWKPSSRMDCVDLQYGFFLICLYAKEDLDFVLQRGPWFIGDHFLSLRPWEPFFKPSMANVEFVAVWVRLNELPIELYERNVLRQIGEAIGRVLRIDTHTTLEARGKYARLCVQIDTSKPLTNTIVMGRFEQPVMYEGIHSLCFSCGHVGHQKDACSFIIWKCKEVLVLVDLTEEGPEKNSCSLHDSVRTDTSRNVTKDSGTEEEGLYGPWMAQRLKLRDSVKGKQVIARGRLGSPSTKSAIDSHPGTSPLQLASILNHGPELLSRAPFKFTANAEVEVGHQPEGGGDGGAGDHKVEVANGGSAIYASPRSEERQVLWNNLAKVVELHNKPWIMVGDFNEPLIEGDKFGGRGVSLNRSLLFKECLDRCNMIDMGFSGSRYTWTNKRDINDLILERIDRFFMNPTWSHNINLVDSIDTFTKDAALWNKNNFGNIHTKKKRVLTRLYGAQRALSNRLSAPLIELEKTLHLELGTLLDQE